MDFLGAGQNYIDLVELVNIHADRRRPIQDETSDMRPGAARGPPGGRPGAGGSRLAAAWRDASGQTQLVERPGDQELVLKRGDRLNRLPQPVLNLRERDAVAGG